MSIDGKRESEETGTAATATISFTAADPTTAAVRPIAATATTAAAADESRPNGKFPVPAISTPAIQCSEWVSGDQPGHGAGVSAVMNWTQIDG